MSKNDRKYDILYAIITDYIKNAEPVSSRTLEKKHRLGISSATIRNEMVDLEDMGYLIQPHTSAGRVPSEKAYRFYVDRFMRVFDIGERLTAQIRNQYEKYFGELNEAIKKTAEILTKITSYTALVSTPRVSLLKIKEIRLIPIDVERIFIVIITKQGIVKNAELKLRHPHDNTQLDRVMNFMNMYVHDSEAEALLTALESKINALTPQEQQIISEIIPVINAVMKEDTKSQIYADGIAEILNYPEFQDVTKARQFMETIHKQELLASLLNMSLSDPFNVKIGTENEIDELSDCSILTATYKLNGQPIGTIGLIGPTRMDYDKCVSALGALTKELTSHIKQSLGGYTDDT